jgi:hypothetical protein
MVRVHLRQVRFQKLMLMLRSGKILPQELEEVQAACSYIYEPSLWDRTPDQESPIIPNYGEVSCHRPLIMLALTHVAT